MCKKEQQKRFTWRSCEGEYSTGASTVARTWRSTQDTPGTDSPKELTACRHKIPRVMHVIHKFLQAIPEIARLTAPSWVRISRRTKDNLFQQQSHNAAVVWRGIRILGLTTLPRITILRQTGSDIAWNSGTCVRGRFYVSLRIPSSARESKDQYLQTNKFRE